MKFRFSLRLLCGLLAAVLLFFAVEILSDGERWFYLSMRTRRYAPLAIQEADGAETSTWQLEELLLQPNVTQNTLMMLVNTAHPLPEGYLPLLEEYNGAQMHPEMVAPYVALRDEVQRRTGIRIYVSSDYRTAEEQAQINAESEAGIAAPVGCSEHEAGMALDVYAPRCGGMAFLKSEAGRLVNRICSEYGFIIRYPYGKEEITGISYEPWHLRYVGAPHATLMSESGLTLEEYIEALVPQTLYESDGYCILRTAAAEEFRLPSNFTSCTVSPDNTGMYVITVRK